MMNSQAITTPQEPQRPQMPEWLKMFLFPVLTALATYWAVKVTSMPSDQNERVANLQDRVTRVEAAVFSVQTDVREMRSDVRALVNRGK
jgi:hypothetical protein